MTILVDKARDELSDSYRILQELIAPIDPALFFENYYEKDALILNRAVPDHHRSILTIDDIDHVVTELALTSSQINLTDAAAAEPLKSSDYIDPSGFADPRRVFQLFEAGATIILPQLNRLCPSSVVSALRSRTSSLNRFRRTCT